MTGGVDIGGSGPALLFCPADRPDRYAKAAQRSDVVILDLEDAVAPASRPGARAALAAHPLDPTRTIVRVNPHGSADHTADIAAALAAGYRTLMLPKAESAAAVRSVEALAAAGGTTGIGLVVLCETAAGVLAAPQLAAEESVAALMWGAEDLVASLGGSSSRLPDGRYRDVARHARSAVLLAAGAHGKAAIDTVHLDIGDLSGLADEARDAVASGFRATACIHPDQVSVIRDAYRPSAEQLRRALALLQRAEGEAGVFRFEGQMVDEPVVRHARALLERAEHTV
ncbi:HpcH/HpaI aldolase/citrate lyase family protein [Microterricola viridarii]|uniref:Citrate lyase n=1 Tax=Microterricola viridarii TaxID=412690 RepID=A0A120I135_9MICO|nr:CoA ester lyase [Microterricola viridarii]AMB58969.1 citrate lyase [Microterricola viridarii]